MDGRPVRSAHAIAAAVPAAPLRAPAGRSRARSGAGAGRGAGPGPEPGPGPMLSLKRLPRPAGGLPCTKAASLGSSPWRSACCCRRRSPRRGSASRRRERRRTPQRRTPRPGATAQQDAAGEGSRRPGRHLPQRDQLHPGGRHRHRRGRQPRHRPHGWTTSRCSRTTSARRSTRSSSSRSICCRRSGTPRWCRSAGGARTRSWLPRRPMSGCSSSSSTTTTSARATACGCGRCWGSSSRTSSSRPTSSP